MQNNDIVAWLGQQVGIKVAESFILPPKKVTPHSRTVKPQEREDFDREGGPSQLPRSYGIPAVRRKSKG